MTIERKAYAKINWDLRVLGKRADGFHALDTVMASVDLHDSLTFDLHSEILMACSDPTLPTDERNLVMKAARLLAKDSGGGRGARINLQKHIPAGGGMGGGSSDAAATLLGLNQLWNLNWPIERLQPLAAELGSDVAFFLHGGWRRCLGRGEIVERLSGSETWPAVRLLLVLPPLQVATPRVYQLLEAPAWDGKSGARNLTALEKQLESDFRSLNGTRDLKLQNDLIAPARRAEPRLEALQQVLQQHRFGRWSMSGSGAAHFVVAAAGDDGSELAEALTTKFELGTRVLTATTLSPLI